jgi:uncharacterized phage protein (TIGR02218 family)
MRSIPTALAAHIAGEVTTLATCWRIKRQDGIVLGFTTHDRPLRINGVVYRAAGGFVPSTMESSSGLDVDNLDIEGILADAALSRADLLAGRYDLAEVEIFLVNWAAPSAGAVMLKTGLLGDAVLKDVDFTVEVRGLSQLLQADIGEVYSPECRANLGDHRCKVRLAAFRVTGAVTAVADSETFSDARRGETDGWFDYGRLAWLSGANAGLECDVKNFTGGEIVLAEPMRGQIAAEDRYEMTAGCDKRFATCRAKFSNSRNFRGEPAVPGQDAVLDYPGLA